MCAVFKRFGINTLFCSGLGFEIGVIFNTIILVSLSKYTSEDELYKTGKL